MQYRLNISKNVRVRILCNVVYPIGTKLGQLPKKFVGKNVRQNDVCQVS